MTGSRRGGALVGAGAAVLVLLCCSGPAAVAAIGAVGIGSWFAANGLWLGAAVVLVAGGALAAARRRPRQSGRGGDAPRDVRRPWR